MTHVFHPRLDGYDERQILHDGCPECESRGRHLLDAFAHLDNANFERAWRRAYAWRAGTEDPGRISTAEAPVLRAIWGVMLCLERRGVAIDAGPPRGLRVLDG